MSKANHYKKFLEDNKTKLLFFSNFKEIIRTKVTSKKTINSIFVNDKITTDASKIANFFNDFYCNIPKKIEKEIPNTLRNYKDYLTNPEDSSFFLSAITTSEVESELKNLKNNKALAPSVYQQSFLKHFIKLLDLL